VNIPSSPYGDENKIERIQREIIQIYDEQFRSLIGRGIPRHWMVSDYQSVGGRHMKIIMTTLITPGTRNQPTETRGKRFGEYYQIIIIIIIILIIMMIIIIIIMIIIIIISGG